MVGIVKFEKGMYVMYHNGKEISKGTVLSKVMLKASKYFKGQGL